VCPIVEQRLAAGLLLSAVPAGDIGRRRRAPGTQQQRRSAANMSRQLTCHQVASPAVLQALPDAAYCYRRRDVAWSP